MQKTSNQSVNQTIKKDKPQSNTSNTTRIIALILVGVTLLSFVATAVAAML